MKYRKGFLDSVNTYEECQSPGADRTEIGLKQFFDKESRGIRPSDPDQYFLRLENGKAWWEWTLNFYQDMWPDNWPEILALANDFKDKPHEFKQLMQRMMQKPSFPRINLAMSPLDVIEACEHGRPYTTWP